MSRILFWRWPLLGLILVIIAMRAPTARWAFALGFAVVSIQLALHLFEPERLKRWLAAGYLFGLDATLIALAFFAVAILFARARHARLSDEHAEADH